MDWKEDWPVIVGLFVLFVASGAILFLRMIGS